MVLLVLCNSILLFAQKQVQGYYQVYAPNTFEFAKYGDVPVDLATGVPQVSLPLMRFSDKGINLDLSLSYHASGIKVDQEATWVGLGWALNAGGVITRELRGRPDEYNSYNGAFNSRTDITDYEAQSAPNNYFSTLGTKLGNAASNNGTDNGADMFYYNFNGKAGKFFLDGSANAVFGKYEDFKVDFVAPTGPNYQNGNYFVITDEQGIRYEFSTPEITTSHVGSTISYTSAWYLSKITSPAGGEITIEYVEGGLSSYSFQKRCYSQAYMEGAGPSHWLPQQYLSPCLNYDNRIVSWVPKKIRSSNGSYIDLVTATTQRLDSELLPNNQLDYLSLYDSGHVQRKRIKFNYSYFEANNSDKFPVSVPSDPRSLLNYRLRLDSFHELSPMGEVGNRHSFEYLGDNNPLTDDVYTLPYRLSPSQDHWGYYNNTNNTTIFPSNPSDRPFDKEPWMLDLSTGDFVGQGEFGYNVPNGGSREADGEATMAGSLFKVTYPTGGYTKFTFEPHDLNPSNSSRPVSGGLRVKELESHDGVGIPMLKNYSYSIYGGTIEKCHSAANPYYTWLSQFIDPSTQVPAHPEFMMALGVPPSLSSKKNVIKVDGSPQLLLGSGTGAFYQTVTETSPGNGSTVYTYNYELDDVVVGGDLSADGLPTPGDFYSTFVDTHPSAGWDPYIHTMVKSYCIFPFPQFRDNSWRRGHLVDRQVFSQQGILLSQDSISYDIKALRVVPGYKVSAITDYQFIYSRYYDVGGMIKPIRQVSKTYNADGTFIRSVKELDYSASEHKQVTETRDYTSRSGSLLTTKYYYPPEYGNTLSSLKNRHILVPVDIRNYKAGKLVSGEQTQYGNNGLPLVAYRAETGELGIDIPFNTQAPYTFAPKLTNVYNVDHSLRSQTVTDATPTIFLWSYKGAYPVAQIQNSTYNEVKTALNDVSETFINALRNKSEPSVADLSILATLRTALPNSHITSYTYEPLVGMTSQTDAKGMTTFYEYDTFGRLENVKDQRGDIVKNYRYNYSDGTALPVRAATYYNMALAQVFTKSCPSGGVAVTYTVEVGKHTSTQSQAAADALAQADATANGQAYANSHGSCSTPQPGGSYPNDAFTVTRTRNNCTVGQTGSSVSYTVPAGTYTSTISQADARTQAEAMVATAAQANANNLGTCSTPQPDSYPNDEFIIYRTRNNCTAGETGSSVSYTVPAGTYTSSVSQADARIQAEQMINAAAQANANIQGSCAVTSGTFTLNFIAPTTAMFEVKVRDMAGNVLSEPKFQGSHLMSGFPGGTGSITIDTWPAGPTPLTFSYNLNGTVINGSPAQFNNLNLSGTINLTVTQTKFFNVEKSLTLERNNCPAGQVGSNVTYTVPTNTYSSTISQTAADQLATNDIEANAQTYANANGSCAVATTPVYFAIPYNSQFLVEFTPTGGATNSYTLQGASVANIVRGTGVLKITSLVANKRYNFWGMAQGRVGSVVEFSPFTIPSYDITISATEIFQNAALTVSKTKTGCPWGQIGSVVPYTVAAGAYTSLASQADADQQAQEDADTNAQTYANANGSCEVSNLTINYAVPTGQQFEVSISGFSNPTTREYISGNGSLTNIPAGGTINIQVVPAVSGQYTFTLAGQRITGTRGNFYSVQVGTVPLQLGIVPVITYYSTAINVSKTKNDCALGYVGTAVDYTVVAGTYISTVSQIAADQQAQEDVDENAQDYANTNGDCSLPITYYNTFVTLARTKNNCPTGQTGSSVTYAVAYGKYSSAISQADANQKAQNDLNTNAQSYANANGTCKVPVTYYSDAAGRWIARTNCSAEAQGSYVFYQVASRTYSSMISQADANQKAQDDINANGENYANANGTCTVPVFTLSYNVPTAKWFMVTISHATGSTATYRISGSGLLENIPGGVRTVSVSPEVPDSVLYAFSLHDGGALAWGNIGNFQGSYLSGSVSLTITE